jgi:hypothetical protein
VLQKVEVSITPAFSLNVLVKPKAGPCSRLALAVFCVSHGVIADKIAIVTSQRWPFSCGPDVRGSGCPEVLCGIGHDRFQARLFHVGVECQKRRHLCKGCNSQVTVCLHGSSETHHTS